MKYLILIGILFNLPFYVYSLSPSFLNMSANELITYTSSHPNDTDARVELAQRHLYGKKGFRKNEREALRLLEEAVEKGHIPAIQKLGSIYQTQNLYDNIDHNLSRTVQLYEQALNIALSSPEQIKESDITIYLRLILNRLFKLHENGEYSSELFLNNALALYKKVHSLSSLKHSEKLAELYAKAEQGDVQALLEASNITHVYDKRNVERRFDLMKAGEMGSVTAMLKLADIYHRAAIFKFQAQAHDGLNLKHTTRTAVNLYKQALLKGSAIAAYSLASIYRTGIREHTSHDVLIKQNALTSRSFYKKAADLGNIDAMRELAVIYEKGQLGVKPNEEKAHQYYEQALNITIEKGDIPALEKLGSIYQTKHIIDDTGNNLSRAVQAYEQALNIALSSPEQTKESDITIYLRLILNRLFKLHENGEYSSELFLNNALALYKKVHSLSSLKHSEKLAELYAKAEQGDVQALLEASNITHVYDKRNVERRFDLMKAGEMGSVTAMLKLADIYHHAAIFKFQAQAHDGLNLKHTTRTAVNLYKQALLKGSAIAAYSLASIYRTGIREHTSHDVLIKQNALISRSFYKKAADLGNIDAIWELAVIYEKGQPGVKPNEEKAHQYYIQHSIGVLEDEKSSGMKKAESMVRLHEIAANGSAEANYQLGRFYRDGLPNYQGFSTNTAIAVSYFEKALEKEQGHEKAETALRQMTDALKANSSVCSSSFT